MLGAMGGWVERRRKGGGCGDGLMALLGQPDHGASLALHCHPCSLPSLYSISTLQAVHTGTRRSGDEAAQAP